MKAHRLIFWLLIFLLPIQLAKHFWPTSSLVFGIKIDYLSPTVYLTDILISTLVLSWLWAEKGKISILGIRSWLKKYWFIWLIFLYLILNSVLAVNSWVAFYKFIKIIEFFILGFYIAKNLAFSSFSTSSNSLLVVIPLSFSVLYESIIAMAQFLKQASLGSVFWWLGERTFTANTPGIALTEIDGRNFLRAYGTFSHPNSLAGFLLISLILIWGLGKKLPVWLKILVTVFSLGGIFFTFSRTIWVAGLIAVFIITSKWLLSRLNRDRPLAYSIQIVILLLFLTSLFYFLPKLQEQTTQERFKLFEASVQMSKKSFLLGLGLNNFIVSLPNFWHEEKIYFLQPVHNIFLLVLVEIGFVGFLIFLWFVWRSLERTITRQYYYLSLALSLVCFTGFFDHYWLTLQQNQLLLALLSGLIWSTKSDKIS